MPAWRVLLIYIEYEENVNDKKYKEKKKQVYKRDCVLTRN